MFTQTNLNRLTSLSLNFIYTLYSMIFKGQRTRKRRPISTMADSLNKDSVFRGRKYFQLKTEPWRGENPLKYSKNYEASGSHMKQLRGSHSMLLFPTTHFPRHHIEDQAVCSSYRSISSHESIPLPSNPATHWPTRGWAHWFLLPH